MINKLSIRSSIDFQIADYFATSTYRALHRLKEIYIVKKWPGKSSHLNLASEDKKNNADNLYAQNKVGAFKNV